MPAHTFRPRIGLVYRGDRGVAGGGSDRADAVLGPLQATLSDLGASVERVVYADDALEEVRDQVLTLDGLLVWVNPIQDGATRAKLDSLLRDVNTRGVYVSARPDVIAKMGTKEVLFHTRTLGWGTDTDLYRSSTELADGLPIRLARTGNVVVKQARGNGGNGTWRVELPTDRSGAETSVPLDTIVRVQHALTRDAASEHIPLGAFLERCNAYFAWSGSLIAQPYQARLRDGMIRCYFVQDRVVGFCHQWPTGLLDSATQTNAATRSRGPWEDAVTPRYETLRTRAESEWVPAMTHLLGLSVESLPIIWDADFLYGPKDAAGNDTYVLCEINISCVWPYPPQATTRMAEAALATLRATRG